MRFKDLKIGTKMYSGFIFTIILTIVVGVIAYTGISKIVYQLEISKIVNRIIVDAGDAQAGSLRYIIYGEEKYYEVVTEEANNIYNLSEEVEKLLLSLENKNIANDIKMNIGKYEKDNIRFYELQKERDEVHDKWINAALDGTKQIVNVIEEATNFSRINSSDYSAVERVYMVQEARNAFNRVRIAGNQYVNNSNDELEANLRKEIMTIKQIFIDAEKIMVSNKTKSAMKLALESIENYEKQFNRYQEILEKQNEIQASQRKNAAELLADARGLRGGVYDYIEKTRASAYTLLIIILIAAVLSGVIIGTIITRIITKPLVKGVEFANIISNGDLTRTLEIDQRDEVGDLAEAMKNMIAKLKDIVTSVISGSDNIASASQQVSSSAQEMSQGANEQAASVEEISSTMEEIAANIEQNSDNSSQTEKIALLAQKGIEDVSRQSQDALHANKKISEKISIITDIAFQTNILALNAAVEAARAGEHGKGFAVVAAEVRKLAERSKVAAEEIVGLAKNSLELTELTGEKMQELLPEVTKTAQLVQEISSASREQNSGALQINNATQQLSNVTQQNAAASEELATSSEEMTSQSEQLQELVSFFKVGQFTIKKNDRKITTKPVQMVKKVETKTQEKGLQSFSLEEESIKDSEFENF